jgi:hypothetical protein
VRRNSFYFLPIVFQHFVLVLCRRLPYAACQIPLLNINEMISKAKNEEKK